MQKIFNKGLYKHMKQNNEKGIWGEFTDLDTGEIIPIPCGTKIILPEQMQHNHEAAEKRKQHEYEFTRDKGERFIFVDSSADNGELLPKFTDISPASVTRLLYLSTFDSYKDVKDKDKPLILGQRYKQPMTYKDLPDVLGVNRRTSDRFLAEVKDRYVSVCEGGVLRLNDSVFWKGSCKRNSMLPLQQLYINPIRSLYAAAQGKHHKQLGYVFMMLPYINREYNVLCYNPFEEDADRVKPLSIKDFCGLISFRDSNVSRLLDIYRSLSFTVIERQQNTVIERQQKFCLFVNDGIKTGGSKIIVNPNILYVGSNSNRVEVLKLFFNN